MRLPDEKISLFSVRLLLLGTVMLLVYASMADLGEALARMGPQVGDIITFRAQPVATSGPGTRLTVARVAGGPCALDLTLLRAGQGSLIVEQQGVGPERLYRAHWAGRRTSRDGDDCGGEADLLLKRSDLDALGTAADDYAIAIGTL